MNEMTEEKIARINELYHKAKTEGLTDAEKEEQQELRKNFIASFRRNLVEHLTIFLFKKQMEVLQI
jgi:uncharacterized protein YnzC (UPF0291/DUF896 family)